MSTADVHSPADFEQNEDAFFPPTATITVVEVDFAKRDDDDECHIFDVAGDHVGFARLGDTFAGSSLSRISEVVGHPDQALVARALVAPYRKRVLVLQGPGHGPPAVETLSDCGSQEVPNRLADECGPEVLSISQVDEFGVETFIGRRTVVDDYRPVSETSPLTPADGGISRQLRDTQDEVNARSRVSPHQG